MQKPHLPVWDGILPHLMKASIGHRTEICGNLGLPFMMVLYLHQRKDYIKRKLLAWRVQKCTPLVGTKSTLTCAGLQTTPSHVSQYMAENGNLQKSGYTFRHGTVFAPKQCLHQKEATDMESPKIHSSIRCKNRTYLFGTAYYPASCKPVYRIERKFVDIWVFLSPWYRLCTKAMFISKGSYRHGESKKFIPLVGAKTALTCARRQTTSSHVSQYRAKNGNLQKSGSTFCHGIVFTPKQCLYQEESTGMESPKVHSSSRCKNRTYQCGT